jgi:hypothetical protein
MGDDRAPETMCSSLDCRKINQIQRLKALSVIHDPQNASEEDYRLFLGFFKNVLSIVFGK